MTCLNYRLLWIILKKSLEQKRKRAELAVEDPLDDDLVIAIIGAPGSGKSTFVNTLLGQPAAIIGDDLFFQTTHIQPFYFKLLDRRVVLVDTPPLDNGDQTDQELIARLTSWLARSYGKNTRFSGVVYLYDITSKRSLTNKTEIDLFERLCGEKWAKKVTLVTTMWNKVTEDVGKRREEQLKELFWSDMLQRGASVHRVDLTQESARLIITSIVGG